MNWYVLLAHPNPASFNHAVALSFVAGIGEGGGEYRFNDLYQSGFDPLFKGEDFNQFESDRPQPADVVAEQAHLDWAQGLALIYPVWWNEAPAILKGWLDRVLAKGYAYEVFEDGSFEGRLRLSKVLILNTADNPLEILEEQGLNQAARLIKDVNTFGFCGVSDIEHHILGQVSTDEAGRIEFLNLARRLGREL
jgi:NAD(P)H dehydrogenase (quinone)